MVIGSDEQELVDGLHAGRPGRAGGAVRPLRRPNLQPLLPQPRRLGRGRGRHLVGVPRGLTAPPPGPAARRVCVALALWRRDQRLPQRRSVTSAIPPRGLEPATASRRAGPRRAGLGPVGLRGGRPDERASRGGGRRPGRAGHRRAAGRAGQGRPAGQPVRRRPGDRRGTPRGGRRRRRRPAGRARPGRGRDLQLRQPAVVHGVAGVLAAGRRGVPRGRREDRRGAGDRGGALPATARSTARWSRGCPTPRPPRSR